MGDREKDPLEGGKVDEKQGERDAQREYARQGGVTDADAPDGTDVPPVETTTTTKTDSPKS